MKPTPAQIEIVDRKIADAVVTLMSDPRLQGLDADDIAAMILATGCADLLSRGCDLRETLQINLDMASDPNTVGAAICARAVAAAEVAPARVLLKMSHTRVAELARQVFGETARVVHGRFMGGQHGEQRLVAGVCRGDALVPSDEHEAFTATMIVLVHRRGNVVSCSPEDFLEDPAPYFPPRPPA